MGQGDGFGDCTRRGLYPGARSPDSERENDAREAGRLNPEWVKLQLRIQIGENLFLTKLAPAVPRGTQPGIEGN